MECGGEKSLVVTVVTETSASGLTVCFSRLLQIFMLNTLIWDSAWKKIEILSRLQSKGIENKGNINQFRGCPLAWSANSHSASHVLQPGARRMVARPE